MSSNRARADRFYQNYLDDVNSRFIYYKGLGDRTFEQLTLDEMMIESSANSNSIAIIIKHLRGNMLSRWTDFLESDGEKQWRNRDREFQIQRLSKGELLSIWEEGWTCLLETIQSLETSDLEKTITIRNQELTVVEAINRQLAHYAYHIGQIVFIGRMTLGTDWKSLSIPKGKSGEFNQEMGLPSDSKKI